MKHWILPALLLIELLGFSSISPVQIHSTAEFFAHVRSYTGDLVAQSGPILLLGFGMTIVLMTAGIDLSVGSMVALVACVMASISPGPGFWWCALPLGLCCGLGLGFANGLLIARLDVPPIIATLGTMIFFRGMCFLLMGELEKSPFVEVPGYDWFGQSGGVAVLVGLTYSVVGWFFWKSRWRRELLMIGGNRIAARYAGIPVTRRLCEVYTVMGGLAFLAALTFTGRNSSVSASSLTGVELHVIVAVVLGGTRVQGGLGSVIGTFFGVLVIAVLGEGLRGGTTWGDHHLPFKISHLENILLGVLLIAAVWGSTVGTRRFAGRRS